MLQFYKEKLGYEISQEKINEINNLEIAEYISKKDLKFQKFNHLTVLKQGPSYISPQDKRTARWWCICDCPEHNIVLVRNTNLTSGNTKSCGCQNNISRKINIKKAIKASRLNLKNQIFGELKALEPTEQRRRNSIVWKCQCSCGKIHYVAANELKARRIESCGCIKESKGVRKIKELLEKSNIPYVTEKTFINCKFPASQSYAKFDFYIDDKFLLEFDGIQHFKEGDKSFFKDSLEQRKYHDNFKNEWCKNNGIPLIRIPYYEIDNLSLDLIFGDKYLV